jgi:hypothetical protein
MRWRGFELGATSIAIVKAIHILIAAFAAFDHRYKLPHGPFNARACLRFITVASMAEAWFIHPIHPSVNP